MHGMFSNTAIYTDNYDDVLVTWSQLALQSNVDFHGWNSKYSLSPQNARNILTDGYRWKITDGGLQN